MDDIESVLRTELESGRGKLSSLDVKKDSRAVIDRKAMARKLSRARGREVSPLSKYLHRCSARRRVELRSAARIRCVWRASFESHLPIPRRLHSRLEDELLGIKLQSMLLYSGVVQWYTHFKALRFRPFGWMRLVTRKEKTTWN